MDGFRETLAAWPSGVSVVTTNADGQLYGLTVSSFSSLSADPPLVLVCVANENRLPAMVDRSGGFAVSILERSQEPASRYFARAGRSPSEDFTEIAGRHTASGQPVIEGSLAWLTCRLRRAIPEGDHTILIGEVVETYAGEGQPLLYWRRAYRSIGTP